MRLRMRSLSGRTAARSTPACEHSWQFCNRTGDRRFWLSGASAFENSGPRSKEPLAIRDMRRVVNGERRSRTFNVLTGAFVP